MPRLTIHRFTGPPVETHAYLLIEADSGEAWVIDAPLETATACFNTSRAAGATISRLLLTHAHFDHILGLDDYADSGLPISLHPDENEWLDYPQTALFGLPMEMPSTRPTEQLNEGQTLRLGDLAFLVRHTPGHSPGSVCLYCESAGLLIGGDLLFQNGVGRTDLPGSDHGKLLDSLKRALRLPDDTRVLPGHGPETTIGAERTWLEALLGRDSSPLTV